MSASRPNLPTRSAETPRPSVRNASRKASAPGTLSRIIPTMGRIVSAGVSGAVSRLSGFERQRTESRKQDLLQGTNSGIETSTALVTDQNEILRDIIEIIKRIKFECPPATGTDIDIDLDRRRQRKSGKGRPRPRAQGRTTGPKPQTQRTPKPGGRVPQVPPAQDSKAGRTPAPPKGSVPQVPRPAPPPIQAPPPVPETPRPPAPIPEAPRPPPSVPQVPRPPVTVPEAPRPPTTVPQVPRPPAPIPEAPRPPSVDAQRVITPPAGQTAAVRDTRGLAESRLRAARLGALFTAIDGLMLVSELDQIEYEYSTNQINQEEYKQKYSSAFGSFLGSTAGAAVLGSIGAVIGAPLFGLGSIVLGTIGGVVGSFAGSQVGAWIGETVAAGLMNDTPPRPPNPRDMTPGDQEEIRQLLLDQDFRTSIDPNIIAVLEIISDESQINLRNRRQARGARNILNDLIRENQSAFAQAYIRREQPSTTVVPPVQTDQPRLDGASELLTNLSSRYEQQQLTSGAGQFGGTEFEDIGLEADKIIFDGKTTFAAGVFGANRSLRTNIARVSTAPAPVGSIVPEVTPFAAPSPMKTAEDAEVTAAPQATPMPKAEIGGDIAAPSAPEVSPMAGDVPTPATAAPVTVAPEPAPAATPAAPPQEQQRGGGDFMSEVNRVSTRFGINPSDLLAVMRSESSLNPRAVNSSTGASGLIQFMPRTAASLGTSVEAIRQMSAVEQMKYVEKFFQSVNVRPGSSAGRLYAYVFLPGRANREVLTQAGENFYEANRGLDVDRDGRITIADLDARLARFGSGSGSAMAQAQPSAPSTGAAVAGQSAQQVISDRDRSRMASAAGGRAQPERLAGRQDAGSSTNRAVGSGSGEVPLMQRLQGAAA